MEPESEIQDELKSRGPLPEHIAVIMDGNGRWAKERGMARVRGHREGVHAVRDVTEACAELGISYLTLYTFSTENWNRPAAEINALMHLLIKALKREASTFHKNRIRLRTIGDIDQLPAACQRELTDLMADTSEYDRMTLILALSYSGRWDISQALRSIGSRIESGVISAEDVDEELIARSMSGEAYPDPDLLIRTGGEKRISNFLLWQMAYTELYFSPIYWPDFRRANLFDAIKAYQDRDRRFGRVQTAEEI